MPPIDHVRAPAKLTRALRVVGVRHDGYHLLAAEMARTGITLARDQRQAPRALKQELPRDLLPGCLAVAA